MADNTSQSSLIPDSEFQSFADLTAKLLAVPKKEIAKKVAVKLKRKKKHLATVKSSQS